MNAPNVNELIIEYARINFESAIMRSHGKEPTPAMHMRAYQIEAWARANLTQAQINECLRQGAAIQTDMHSRYVQASQDKGSGKQKLNQTVGNLTRGMLGQNKLTPQQLAAIVNKTPFRAEIPPKQQETPAQKDTNMRALTKHMDPRGLGWSVKEFETRMDAITDAGPKEFARLAKGFRLPQDQLLTSINGWKTERIKHGLARKTVERYGERETAPILNRDASTQVNDREHRRAVLATAFLADAKDQWDSGEADQLAEFADETPTYEEGRRSDLALAWDKSEGA